MADQLLTVADAEQAVIDELTPWIKIGTALPPTLPPVFARVVAAGGINRDLVTDRPTLVLEVFAKLESVARDKAAEALARLELAVRKGRLGNETAYDMQVAALPQNFPLPSVPTHKRYVTTIAPAVRRRVTTI